MCPSIHLSFLLSLIKALSKANICHFIQLFCILVINVTGKSMWVLSIHLQYPGPSSVVRHRIFNLQSLSSPSFFSATLLPLLPSPPTQKQIHCLPFYVSILLHHFLDILMLCPLWIVYSVRALQEITSLRIF